MVAAVNTEARVPRSEAGDEDDGEEEEELDRRWRGQWLWRGTEERADREECRNMASGGVHVGSILASDGL